VSIPYSDIHEIEIIRLFADENQALKVRWLIALITGISYRLRHGNASNMPAFRVPLCVYGYMELLQPPSIWREGLWLMCSMLKRMMTNSAIYALGEVTVRFSGLLLIPLYTRYLTPEDYGVLSVANTLTAILAIFIMLSLNGAFMRFYFDCRNQEEQQHLLSSIVYFVLGWAFILAGVLWSGGEWLFGKLMAIAFHPYIELAIGIALAGLLPQIILSVFQVQEKAKTYALFTIFSFLATVGFVVYHVVFLKEGAQGSLEGTLTGMLIMSVIAFTLLKKNWLVPAFNMVTVRKSLGYSVPLIPHLLMIWVMMGSDVFILQYFRPMPEVGIYSLGYTLGFAFFVVTGALSKAWVPIFYRHADDETQQNALSQVITTMLMLMLFVVACSMLFLKEVIALVTIEAFYDVILIIPWVALASIFHIVYISFVNVLFYHKKIWIIAIISACAALCNVILNFIFIPEFGMQAAAITTATAYLLQMGLVWFFSRPVMVIPYYRRKVFLTALACSMMLGTEYSLDIDNEFFLLPLKIALVICTAGILLYARILVWKDIERLRNSG